MKLDLIQFLRSGEIPELPFGMTRGEMIEKLGKTESFGYAFRRDRAPSFYKYDRVEFYFDGQHGKKVTGVMVQPLSIPAEVGALEFDYQWLTNSLSIDQAEIELNTISVQYRRGISDADNSTPIIQTAGGVILYFFDEQPFTLSKAGRFPETKNCRT